MVLKFGATKWFVFVISILLLTDLAILFNIPFLRQIIGFLFLIFLPGLLILRVLKLDKIESTEKLVLSVGLSIIFLMFFGLLINYLLLSIGYETPLATVSILISFNIAFVVLAIIGYKRNENLTFSLPNFNLSTSEKAFLIVPILFPALSILGTYIMKTVDDNSILMLLLFLIPIYVCFVCFFNHKFSKRLYPAVIFLISISLLLIFMMRFPHICGHDVHEEYGLFFRTTFDNLHWSVFGHSTLDACLSISLLPTIFQSILNVNADEYLFKGVYVSICSFGPLAIYIISKKYVDEIYAFLASFFFMSQIVFLSVAGSPRTNLAIFFTALAVMVFFSDKINPVTKRALFIVFLLSMVVSHYSTTYIFFFVILFSWFAVELLSKKYTFKKILSLTLVLIFFAFIFCWYSQVTVTPFNAGMEFVEETFLSLNKFFIEESRSPELKHLVGKELAYPMLSKACLVFTWATFILIGIGVLSMLARYRRIIDTSNVKLKEPDFLKTEFEMEYLVMALACGGLLAITVVLPYISKYYGIHRLYSLLLIILSVCLVIGGITLSKHFFFWQKKTCAKRKHWFLGKAFFVKEGSDGTNRQQIRNGLQVRACSIILLILIPYFMFQTGAMYQIFGAPVSINLNSEGEGYDREYIYDSEVYSVKWLESNANRRFAIYTGAPNSLSIFLSQANVLSNNRRTIIAGKKIKGYVFLGYYNIIDNKLLIRHDEVVDDKLIRDVVVYNTTDRSDIFVDKNRIYSNGESEVWSVVWI